MMRLTWVDSLSRDMAISSYALLGFLNCLLIEKREKKKQKKKKCDRLKEQGGERERKTGKGKRDRERVKRKKERERRGKERETGRG